jgi:glycosyltransferase involved in cell wall biosynthesis
MPRPLKIAMFSPLPPAHTGIADYSAELLPYLNQVMQVAVFTDAAADVSAELAAQYPVYPTEIYPAHRREYDIALYQMGNSGYHETMYEMLLRYPGVVVLHDYGLHHFIAHHTIGRDRPWAYVRELGYALGPDGVRLGHAILRGEQPRPVFDISLNDRLLDVSLGVIVHSQYAQTRIATRGHAPARASGLPVTVIPAPIAPHSPVNPLRPLEGWPADALVFASLGGVTLAKGIVETLRAFKRLRANLPQARFLVVGEWTAADVDLPALVAEMDLQDDVRCTGFVDDLQTFVDWIGATDVVVNLRNPTVGETSATALRALAAGRPLIVSDHGWYAELPDGACLKARPGDEESLFAAMQRMALDPALRLQMGQFAAGYARDTHSPAHAAAAYAHFIGQLLPSRSED